jgi:hypothetical protein
MFVDISGFNPAARVKRPKIVPYAQVQLLSRDELSALLGILKQDDSPLGKRAYAFTLAKVRMGVPLKALQRLQWGQIERDGYAAPQGELRDGTWVHWRPQAKRAPLPGEVWEAIRACLASAGRLAGIGAGVPQWELRDDNYIFAPLASADKAGENNTAQDWAGERCLTTT